MGERNYLAEGIILRSRDYGDYDKILTFFSLEHGKISAIAKGVRKQKSSLRGCVQVFSYSRLALFKGHGTLDTVTQGEAINPFLGLREDLDKISYASYLAELMDVGMPEEKENTEAFILLLTAFSLIELSDDLLLARYFFELRFLNLLGLCPNLEKCTVCGHKLINSKFFLSPIQGGLLCQACAGVRDSLLLSAGTIQTMKKLMTMEIAKLTTLKISQISYQEMEGALNNYYDYHLEKAARSRSILKELCI